MGANKRSLQGAWLAKKHGCRGRTGSGLLPGMMLHIDGNKHIAGSATSAGTTCSRSLDDATTRDHYAQLVKEESTRTAMVALREAIERKGLFCALYSDRGSHSFWTPKAGEALGKQRVMQVGRALKELGIQMIPAYSPHARGPCVLRERYRRV